MSANQQLREYVNSNEIARESEDLSIILYKRHHELAKRYRELKLREERANAKIKETEDRLAKAQQSSKDLICKRMAVQEKLERKEFKLQALEQRLDGIQRNTERCDADIEIAKQYKSTAGEVEQQLSAAIDVGYKKTQALIKANKKKDFLQRMLLVKEDNYRTIKQREMEVEEQRNAMVKQEKDMKQAFKEAIANATEAYHNCVEIAPKILLKNEKIKRLEVDLEDLQHKCDVRDDQLRKVRKEVRFLKDKLEMHSVELTVKKERKAKEEAEEAEQNKTKKPKQTLVFRHKLCHHGHAQKLEECLRKGL